MSVFIVLNVRGNLDIKVEKRGQPALSAAIDKYDGVSIILIPGKCDVKFVGDGRILLANITYQKDSDLSGLVQERR